MNIVEMTESHLSSFAELYVEMFNAPPWSEDWSVAVAATRLGEIMSTPGFLGRILSPATRGHSLSDGR